MHPDVHHEREEVEVIERLEGYRWIHEGEVSRARRAPERGWVVSELVDGAWTSHALCGSCAERQGIARPMLSATRIVEEGGPRTASSCWLCSAARAA